MTKKRSKPDKVKVKKWLKDKKHEPEKVDALSYETDEQIVDSLSKLHNVNYAELKRLLGEP